MYICQFDNSNNVSLEWRYGFIMSNKKHTKRVWERNGSKSWTMDYWKKQSISLTNFKLELIME